VAIIRAGLSDLGVEELFFSDLDHQGYVLVVQPTEPIEMSEVLAEGCWTFTPEGELELGLLLKGLSELTWRAWDEAEVPQIVQQLSEAEESAGGTESAPVSADQPTPSPTPEAAPGAARKGYS
jgi:hypothetical protein